MRKSHLLTTAAVAIGSLACVIAAQAADLPRQVYKAPPAPMIAPPFSWTGFYIGANVGAAWSRATIDASTGGSLGTNTNASFIGGGQLGYNWQFNNNWVLGIEGTADGIASHGKHTNNILIGGQTFNATANSTWLATVAGRLGYTWDTWMLYGKGGGAWVGWDRTVNWVNTGLSSHTTNSQGGWLAGVGLEYAFNRNWTAKAEYNYIGLNGEGIGTLNGVNFNVRNPRLQTFTVGVNYLFH